LALAKSSCRPSRAGERPVEEALIRNSRDQSSLARAPELADRLPESVLSDSMASGAIPESFPPFERRSPVARRP
jgi:hypothetical protein